MSSAATAHMVPLPFTSNLAKAAMSSCCCAVESMSKTSFACATNNGRVEARAVLPKKSGGRWGGGGGRVVRLRRLEEGPLTGATDALALRLLQVRYEMRPMTKAKMACLEARGQVEVRENPDSNTTNNFRYMELWVHSPGGGDCYICNGQLHTMYTDRDFQCKT